MPEHYLAVPSNLNIWQLSRKSFSALPGLN
jgi:hypothetical protein